MDIKDAPTAELPALVEQGMPVADYLAEMERRGFHVAPLPPAPEVGK